MTNTKDEALKLALEALTVLLDEWTPARQAQLKGMDAVKAVKQALAAPVQEPVSALTNLRVPKERINEIQGGLMAYYSSGAQAPKDLLFAASDCIGALTFDLIDAKRAAQKGQP